MKPVFRMVFAALLTLAAPAGVSAQTLEEVVGDIVELWMAIYQVPGVSLVVAKRSTASATEPDFLLARGYGVRDRTTNVEVSAETVFELGSVTKPYTAAIIMRLQEQFRLHVGNSVSSWISGFGWFGDFTSAFSPEMTIEHMLQMRTGVQEQWSDCPTCWMSFSQQKSLREIAENPEAFAPGAYMQYTNGNYYVLARIVTAVTGQSFETNLANQILTPLGLKKTFTTWPPTNHADYATGYSYALGGHITMPVFPRNVMSGYANISATARDVARFSDALMRGRVVTPASFNQMTTPSGVPVFGSVPGDPCDNRLVSDYGYGLKRTKKECLPASVDADAVWHSGQAAGHRSTSVMFPGWNSGLMVVLLNNLTENADAALELPPYDEFPPYDPDVLTFFVIEAICNEPALASLCS